jgi:hypothetical protein
VIESHFNIKALKGLFRLIKMVLLLELDTRTSRGRRVSCGNRSSAPPS